jgi:hypothetical protein
LRIRKERKRNSRRKEMSINKYIYGEEYKVGTRENDNKSK